MSEQHPTQETQQPKKKEKKVLTQEELAKIEEMKKKNDEERQKKIEEKKKQQQQGTKKEEEKKVSLGLEVKKLEDFSQWYTEVLTKSEMIDYYDISGCYIFRPWSYRIWELIQQYMDAEFKKLGVQNCYFPIFVTKKALERESGHIQGFAPEVAW